MGAALLFARYSNRLIFAQDAKLLRNFDFDQQFAKKSEKQPSKRQIYQKSNTQRQTFFFIYWRKNKGEKCRRDLDIQRFGET